MLPIIISAIESPEDRDLMTEFYMRCSGLMHHEAQKYLSVAEDVEDVVYEALAKIIDKMEVFRELKHRQQVQYALTTVRNLSYIMLRRQKRFEFISFDDIDLEIFTDESESLEDAVQRSVLNAGVRKIWNSLGLEDKIILQQKYVLHWSNEEIAEPLEIKPESVRMRLSRAKRNLIQQLQKQEFNVKDWL